MRAIKGSMWWIGVLGLAWCLSGGGALGAEKWEMEVRVQETRGLGRRGELVSVDVTGTDKPLAVLDGEGKAVASQVVNSGGRRTVWFAVDAPANATRTYRIVEGEPAAPQEPLQITGRALEEEVRIANPFYSVKLKPKNGNVDRIVLHGEPEKLIWNKAGTLHWNPGIYSLEEGRVWSKTGGWSQTRAWDPAPGLREQRGPLLYAMSRKGALPDFDEVEVEVRYRFSATEPHMYMESTIKLLQEVRTVRALRNGECVFQPGLVTHAACKGRDGKTHEWKLPGRAGEETSSPAKPDDEWLAFYNPDSGVGLATIRLKVENKGPEGKEPTLADYRMQISVIDYATYWARALVFPRGPLDSDKHCVDVPAGNVYFEREAWLPFDASGPEPLRAVEEAAQRLLHPLKVEIAVKGR